MRIFKGIAASEGLAKGKALVHHHASMAAEKQHILADGVPGELAKFRSALQTAKQTLQEHDASNISRESKDILETHLLMLEDPEYIQQIEAYITTNLVCAQWAIDSVTSSMVALLEQTDDDLLRERAVDFKDVSLYLIDAIKGKGQRRMEHLSEDVILVADILMPSELFAMDKTHILGICLDGGGRASHVAILVRAFNIPTVLAAGGASKTVNDGDEIIVDGTYGEAFIRPDHTVSQMLDERYALWQQHELELHQMAGLSTTTTDGREILLKTNIQTANEWKPPRPAVLQESGCSALSSCIWNPWRLLGRAAVQAYKQSHRGYGSQTGNHPPSISVGTRWSAVWVSMRRTPSSVGGCQVLSLSQGYLYRSTQGVAPRQCLRKIADHVPHDQRGGGVERCLHLPRACQGGVSK